MAISVFIYEDNNNLRESLCTLFLLTEQFEVTGAFSNCMDVTEQVRKNLPDIILMDIDMPGLNGIEATALVKSHHPEIKVLILTSYDDSEKIFDALQSGATGYLLKKTTPAKIMDAITEVS